MRNVVIAPPLHFLRTPSPFTFPKSLQINPISFSLFSSLILQLSTHRVELWPFSVFKPFLSFLLAYASLVLFVVPKHPHGISMPNNKTTAILQAHIFFSKLCLHPIQAYK